MLIFSIVPSVMALPSNTVVIGNQAFSMDLFFQDNLPDSVINALIEGGDIYFDVGTGYMDAWTGAQMPETAKSNLSNIEYMNSDGSVCVYSSFDDIQPAASKKAAGQVQITNIGSAKIVRIYVNSADLGTQFSYNGTTKVFGEYVQFTATTDLTSVKLDLLNAAEQKVGTLTVSLNNGTFETEVTLIEASVSMAEGSVQLTSLGTLTLARVSVNSADVGTQFSYNGITKALGETLQLTATGLTSVELKILQADGSEVGTITVPLTDGEFQVTVE